MSDVHPAFLRAAALHPDLRRLFPTSSQEAAAWRPTFFRRALASRVLVVATTRVECAWAAYIDAVPGLNHALEQDAVVRHGGKLDEWLARCLFPWLVGVPYAD